MKKENKECIGICLGVILAIVSFYITINTEGTPHLIFGILSCIYMILMILVILVATGDIYHSIKEEK